MDQPIARGLLRLSQSAGQQIQSAPRAVHMIWLFIAASMLLRVRRDPIVDAL